jgi:hypothetical protein
MPGAPFACWSMSFAKAQGNMARAFAGWFRTSPAVHLHAARAAMEPSAAGLRQHHP